jgi:UDP-glucose 4-epimerase
MSAEARNGKYVLLTGGTGYIGSHTVISPFESAANFADCGNHSSWI